MKLHRKSDEKPVNVWKIVYQTFKSPSALKGNAYLHNTAGITYL